MNSEAMRRTPRKKTMMILILMDNAILRNKYI